jgi:hypothetical protein
VQQIRPLNQPEAEMASQTITPVNDIEAADTANAEKITPIREADLRTRDDNALEKPETLRPDAAAQAGVQKVQAITLSWTKVSLVALLCL